MPALFGLGIPLAPKVCEHDPISHENPVGLTLHELTSHASAQTFALPLALNDSEKAPWS
jgi:hypothetical protein